MKISLTKHNIQTVICIDTRWWMHIAIWHSCLKIDTDIQSPIQEHCLVMFCTFMTNRFYEFAHYLTDNIFCHISHCKFERLCTVQWFLWLNAFFIRIVVTSYCISNNYIRAKYNGITAKYVRLLSYLKWDCKPHFTTTLVW